MTYNDLMHNGLASLPLLSETMMLDLFLMADADALISKTVTLTVVG